MCYIISVDSREIRDISTESRETSRLMEGVQQLGQMSNRQAEKCIREVNR